MKTSLPTAALLLASLLSPLAEGQESDPRAGNYQVNASRRYSPPEAIHRHSSTAYEGARRGEAAWITAAGEYLVDEAQAEILWQQAEKLHYDNELNKTATALTRKKMLNGFRDYERQRRLDRKEQSKQLWEEKYQELAHTYRLDEFQMNWETGAIYWPALAASPRYALQRQRLEQLMARIVTYGESRYGFEGDEIAQACDTFRKQLQADFEAGIPVSRAQYAELHRFLLGLKYAPVLLQHGESNPTLAMR